MTRHRWLITGLAVAALALGACNSGTSSAPKTEAIKIVEDEASGLKTLTLSEKAAQRLGVETAEVGGAGSGMTIPYAAIVYDATGKTWTYVTAEPLTYKRAEITVNRKVLADLAVHGMPDCAQLAEVAKQTRA